MTSGNYPATEKAIRKARSGDKAALSKLFENADANEWTGTVQHLVENGVDDSVIESVVKNALNEAFERDESEVRSSLVKSDSVEKVDFETEVSASPVVFKAGSDDFVIWGPASIEIVDKEGDRIRASALEDALPQLLKRARLSLEHSDQLVGGILERFETEEPVEVTVGDKTFERSEFPTDVLELDGMEPGLYVAGEVYGDTRQAEKTRERIENGELNSYSISGEALVTRKKVSDGTAHDDILDMDLSAVTICEEGMNQKAQFAQISGNSSAITASQPAGNNSEIAASASNTENQSEPVAKNGNSETMSGTNTGDSSGGQDLTEQFGKVLDEKLPDGDLATKDDMRDVARNVYEEQASKESEEGTEHNAEDAGQASAQESEEGEEAESAKADDEPPMEGEGEGEDDEEDEEEKAEDEPPMEGEEDEEEEDEEEKADTEALAEEYENLTADEIEALLDNANEGADDDADVGGTTLESADEEEMPEEGEDDEEDEEEGMKAEEEEMPEEGEGEEDDEEEPPMDEKGGYTSEELEEMLPGDVYDVVREYLDEDEEMEGGDEMGEEGEAVDAVEASDDDLERAVKSVLDGEGLSKTGGVDSPPGEAEPAFDAGAADDPEIDKESEADADAHGNNPALANIYGD